MGPGPDDSLFDEEDSEEEVDDSPAEPRVAVAQATAQEIEEAPAPTVACADPTVVLTEGDVRKVVEEAAAGDGRAAVSSLRKHGASAAAACPLLRLIGDLACDADQLRVLIASGAVMSVVEVVRLHGADPTVGLHGWRFLSKAASRSESAGDVLRVLAAGKADEDAFQAVVRPAGGRAADVCSVLAALLPFSATARKRVVPSAVPAFAAAVLPYADDAHVIAGAFAVLGAAAAAAAAAAPGKGKGKGTEATGKDAVKLVDAGWRPLFAKALAVLCVPAALAAAAAAGGGGAAVPDAHDAGDGEAGEDGEDGEARARSPPPCLVRLRRLASTISS